MPTQSPQNIVKLEVKAVIPHKKKNIFEDESALLVKKSPSVAFYFRLIIQLSQDEGMK